MKYREMSMTQAEPSRLDRIEAIVETLVNQSQVFREDLQELRLDTQAIGEQVSNLTEDVQATLQMINTLAQEGARDRQDIRTIQTEVRGLQQENRRILDYLFNQQQGGGE